MSGLPPGGQPPPATNMIVMPAQSGVTRLASDAIDALRTSPVLLLIVVLNMVFAMSAGYYLLKVEGYRAADRTAIVGLIDKCITETVPLAYKDRKP